MGTHVRDTVRMNVGGPGGVAMDMMLRDVDYFVWPSFTIDDEIIIVGLSLDKIDKLHLEVVPRS